MSIIRYFARQLKQPNGIVGYLFTGHFLNWENRATIQHTVDLLRIQPDDQVLDIGFGGGRSIQVMALAAPNGLIVGIDVSQPMIKRARSRFANQISRGQIRIEFGSISNLTFNNGTFDKISAIHTIYFWPDLDQGVNEALRVMKIGGCLVVAIHSKQKMQND